MECHHITWVCLVYQKHGISYPSSSFKSQWDVFLGFFAGAARHCSPWVCERKALFFGDRYAWTNSETGQYWESNLDGEDLPHLFHLLCIWLSLMKKLMAKTLQRVEICSWGRVQTSFGELRCTAPKRKQYSKFSEGWACFVTDWVAYVSIRVSYHSLKVSNSSLILENLHLSSQA